MKLTPMKFYWTALAVTITAFIFSLSFNYPSYADSNNNINNTGMLPLDVNVWINETWRDGEETWGGKQDIQTAQLGWLTVPTEKDNTWVDWGTRITQTEDEHVKQWNGSMYAIDVVTDSGDAYFPEAYNEYFIVHIWEDERLWNYIIIRHDKERWVFGHIVTSRPSGSYVLISEAGNVLWQYNKSGVSTAPHAHIEKWICPLQTSKMKDCSNISSTGQVAPRNKELKEQRGWVDRDASTDNERKSDIPKLPKVTVQNWWDSVTVIACLNENDMTIHEAKGSWSTACFLWKGWKWKNIMLPPQKDLDKFKEIFWEDYKYRLAIANFEGSFREDAGNASAKWYLQTLRSYNIPNDITSQLNWLKTREIGTTGRICDLNGWNKTKLDRYVCMAGGHFWFFKPGDKHYAHSVMYKKRYRAVTEYYLSLNF